jgi:hypothetical protein
VIPIHITPDWNIITRTILPVVWNPDLSPVPTVPVGTAPSSTLGLSVSARPHFSDLGPELRSDLRRNRQLGLMALTLVLTATFRSSDNLAAAFGVAGRCSPT